MAILWNSYVNLSLSIFLQRRISRHRRQSIFRRLPSRRLASINSTMGSSDVSY